MNLSGSSEVQKREGKELGLNFAMFLALMYFSIQRSTARSTALHKTLVKEGCYFFPLHFPDKDTEAQR